MGPLDRVRLQLTATYMVMDRLKTTEHTQMTITGERTGPWPGAYQFARRLERLQRFIDTVWAELESRA